MSLKERVYSVLIVSASEAFDQAMLALLPNNKYHPIGHVSSINAAKRVLVDKDFDYVIINSPLPDDPGMRFAIDICDEKGTVVLLAVKAELFDEIYDKAAEHGVFVISKPIARPTMVNALQWMVSARERLRRTEKKTISIEDKMEEIRLVNRAKWILISEQGFNEPDAHRYIEKQAMDRCVPKKVIADEIIKTYT